MKKYTIDEKVKHHKKTPMYENGKYNDYWEFGNGYNMAVTIYRSYIKMDKQSRKVADEINTLLNKVTRAVKALCAACVMPQKTAKNSKVNVITNTSLVKGNPRKRCCSPQGC